MIEHRGRRVTVDLGAQFFHPDTHPIYVTLLEELGLYDPEQPDGDATVQSPASLCIFRTGGGAPIFSSSHALSTPERAIEFAKFTQLARQAVLSDLSWEITVEAWIRSLPLQPSFKQDVLHPWIAALIGCARSDARRASARSILQTFALAFPADLLEPATTYTSKLGLQGNLQRMLRRSPTARVHRQHAGAGPEPHTRRLVPADAGGPEGAVPVRGVERASACRPRVAASAAGIRRGHGVAGRVPLLRLAPAGPHRPGLHAPRSRQLGGLQRRCPRSRVRGQRLARRSAGAVRAGRGRPRVQVVGHRAGAPTRSTSSWHEGSSTR